MVERGASEYIRWRDEDGHQERWVTPETCEQMAGNKPVMFRNSKEGSVTRASGQGGVC